MANVQRLVQRLERYASMRTSAGAGAPQQCKDNKEEREKLHGICQDYKAKKVMGVCAARRDGDEPTHVLACELPACFACCR